MDEVEILRICEFLQKAEITGCELLLSGSNWVFVADLALDGQVMKAVYKPRKGEAPLWDFPDGTLYKREYAAFRVSTELGWDIIPPTVIRNGPYGIGSMQLMIEVSDRIHDLEEVARGIIVFKQVALFDYLTNNADRKAGHFLLDRDKRLWVIDHGLTFNIEPKLRTVLWDFAGEAVPPELLADVNEFRRKLNNTGDLRKDLAHVIQEREITAMERRIRKILRSPVFPHPTPVRSVPWAWY